MEIPISKNLSEAFAFAKKIAKKYSSPEVGTEHILYGLVMAEGSYASKLLTEQGVKGIDLEAILADGEHVGFIGTPQFTSRVVHTINQAHWLARTKGEALVDTEQMLFCMLNDSSSLAYSILANKYRLDIKVLIASLSKRLTGEQTEPASGVQSSPLPQQLSDIGVDLTQKAREHRIDPIIGRKDEIERIIQILCRKSKNNPILIGEPGVGKSAVTEGLAQAIVEGNVPELLKDKIVFSLDIGSLVAGTKYRGALEEKLKEAINLIRQQQNIIVFIDELHTLAQAGSKDGEVSPADILKPYLSRGELQTIGATTTDEYKKFIEKDKALERRFQPIIVSPPSVEETKEILRGLRPNYEAFHKIKITDEAIDAAAKLSDRYIMDRFLPDKAIDLIDEAMSKAKVSGNTAPSGVKAAEEKLAILENELKKAVEYQDFVKAAELKNNREALKKDIENIRLEWSKSSERAVDAIGAEEIAEIVSKWTKIPVTKLNETETQRLVELEKILHKRVIGQDKAIESVSRAIRRARAGLKDPNRPIGSFLFLGPTGVGKTELTKALSEAMYDDENAIIRLDMSEYMEPHSVSKLIGSPPGYIGYDEGGQLTEQVRRKPYSVILFDEIEKAHNDVYNILLQMMDDGRLTDAQGRIVSFKNTLIILTSNVGVQDLQATPKKLGFYNEDENSDEKNYEAVLGSALKKHFRPEFINRIDVICYFHHLTKNDMEKIARVLLDKVNKTLAEKRITLSLTKEAMQHIIQKGYSFEYGARPLRRVIEQDIEDLIAEQYLEGKISDGTNLVADISDDAIIIQKRE